MLALYAALNLAHAGDCASHPLFTPGTTLTMSQFDAKGKPSGATTSRTASAAPVEGGLQAQIHAESTDAKGKATSTLDYTLACTADGFGVSARAFLADDLTEAYKDQKFTVEATDVVFPDALTAGQALPDGQIKMTFTPDPPEPGMIATVVGVALTGRTVEAVEPVTTEAGTWTAYKIHTQATHTITTILTVNIKTEIVEWYVPGVGVVRSQSLRKGKLAGESRLTSLVKGG